MAQKKINKVVRQLKKASKTHAGQAKTLESIKMKKGGGAKSKTPSNVANPSLYAKAKAKAKRKFDVYPSAYANAYMVQEYKRMGANLEQIDRNVIVCGKQSLQAAPVEATDLRAAAGLLLASWVAEGVTRIKQMEFIDRGYEHLYEKLMKLGLTQRDVITQ